MTRIYSIILMPLLLLAGEIKIGGPVAPDGKTEVAIDLPVDQRTRNTGGKDGAGLCVFTSIQHSARWQNEKRLWDFQAQMKKELGGGWPDKVDKMISKYGPGTEYVQYIGDNPAILKACLATGRLPCVTWNGNHMLNLVYLDDKWACILDNNHIGENELRWMTPAEFYEKWRDRGAWTVILLSAPPPPPPWN